MASPPNLKTKKVDHVCYYCCAMLVWLGNCPSNHWQLPHCLAPNSHKNYI